MTVIVPHPHNPLLAPYAEPLGRMMLGYGRAMIALRGVAQIALGDDEQKAIRFMRGVKSKNLVDKFSELCAPPKFTQDRQSELLEYCRTLVELNTRRNRIVHGEWWFYGPDASCLLVRDWDDETAAAVHDETVTPESLDQLAREFSEVSSDLDIFSYMPDVT